jgi:DNA-binding beta-propeller fold protein YncE
MLLRLRTLFSPRGTAALLVLATGLAGTAFGQLLYVPNSGSNNISEFSTIASSPAGKLSALCTPLANSAPASSNPTGTNPSGLAMTPNGKFLYTADNNSGGGVSAFAVSGGPSCVGQLSPLAVAGSGCPAASGETCPAYTLQGNPFGVAVDPSGQYLYATQPTISVAGNIGAVSAFSINQTTGALTLIGTYPTPNNSGPNAIATATEGGNEYVYVGLVNALTSNVEAFPITAGTGALGTPAFGTVNSGTGSPAGLIANGAFLFVTDFDSAGTNGLVVFNIGSGAPTSPIGYTTGSVPQGIAVDSVNNFLYVASLGGGGSVKAYSLSGGVPTLVKTVTGPTNPVGVTVDPGTSSVYVSDDGSDDLWGYTPGLAAAISGSPFTNLATNGEPGQFLLAHVPPPPVSTSVPAASYTSLALLAFLLAACAGVMYRKSIRPSSAQ